MAAGRPLPRDEQRAGGPQLRREGRRDMARALGLLASGSGPGSRERFAYVAVDADPA